MTSRVPGRKHVNDGIVGRFAFSTSTSTVSSSDIQHRHPTPTSNLQHPASNNRQPTSQQREKKCWSRSPRASIPPSSRLAQSDMPEQRTLQQSHAQMLRENAARRLSRSPHPYHRLQSELPYASERFNDAGANAPAMPSPLHSSQNTDDEELHEGRALSRRDRELTTSDSGTEADDEHFLKGLPAPKSRPRKGLRGESSPLGTPSPLLSPAILDESGQKYGYPGWPSKSQVSVDPAEAGKVAEKFRRRRRIEIVRRLAEVAILIFIGSLLCLDPQIRNVLFMWRRGMLYCRAGLF